MATSIVPGHGVVHCGRVAHQPKLFQCVGQYPVKLIPTRVHSSANRQARPLCASEPQWTGQSCAVYIVTYGGGIVHGDRIQLDIHVDPGVGLTLLTQGSTKVFRARKPHDAAIALQPKSAQPPSATPGTTSLLPTTDTAPALFSSQYATITVAPGGCLVYLPSPVTCFRGSRYVQRQRITLQSPRSSAVFLDWFTGGRSSRGELWEFDLYNSINTVLLNDRPIFKDAVHLSDRFQAVPDHTACAPRPTLTTIDGTIASAMSPDADLDTPASTSSSSTRPLPNTFAERLHPFQCFAVLVILPGASACLAQIRQDLLAFQAQDKISGAADPSFRRPPTAGGNAAVVYSVSDFEQDGVAGVAVRLSAMYTEAITAWIRQHLAALEPVIGGNIWTSMMA
ncbi:hypothetical protein H4R34_003218 [Dimargaris verticillata]|uniref:UreD urease accessory protein-domain-containing protein n=1 Tax=Dimargaris verticillata TaxID=2761393 RepID=A0A9W8E994_9FUNG|nr:hypothetical protein H4R34_003218 [Dimargaris verticillata]